MASEGFDPNSSEGETHPELDEVLDEAENKMESDEDVSEEAVSADKKYDGLKLVVDNDTSEQNPGVPNYSGTEQENEPFRDLSQEQKEARIAFLENDLEKPVSTEGIDVEEARAEDFESVIAPSSIETALDAKLAEANKTPVVEELTPETPKPVAKTPELVKKGATETQEIPEQQIKTEKEPPEHKKVPKIDVAQTHEEMKAEIENMPTGTADEVYKMHDAIQKMDNEDLEKKYQEKVEIEERHAEHKTSDEIQKDEYLNHPGPGEDDMNNVVIPETNAGQNEEAPTETTTEKDDVPVHEKENVVTSEKPVDEIPVPKKEDMVVPEALADNVTQITEKPVEKVSLEQDQEFPQNEGENKIKVEEADNEDFENVTLETENKGVGDVVPKKERGIELDESKTESMAVDTPHENTPGTGESFKPMPSPEQMLIDEFGISKERIATIKGFGDLTEGQQNLVVENLRTAKLGMVQNGAEQQFKKDTAEARFVGKIWNSLSKGWKISSLEQSTKEDLDRGGIDIYGKTLTNLIGVAKDGPGVEYVNGEAVMQYVPEYENLEPQQMEKVKHFNEVANSFTKIPDEWGYESASKRERGQFKASQAEYTKAKEQMIALNLEQTDGNEKAAAEFIFNIDEQVQMGRFLNTHREAKSSLMRFLGHEKNSGEQVQGALDKIDSSVIWRGFTKTVGDRGANALRGYAVRSGLTFAIGFGGVVLAGGLVGGYMGHKQAEKSLQERDRARREGEEDISKEAKNYVDANEQVEKLNLLISRYENADDPIKKQKILHSMEARIGFIEQKMNAGETVYGKGAEKISNQVELLKAKSMVKATHAIESEEMEESKASESRKDKLNSRLASKLEGTKEEIEEVRKVFRTAGMKKGAAIGLGFAIAGAAVREFVFNSGNEASGVVSGGAKVVAETAPRATAVETVGVPTPMVHEVVKGDNLWNIIKEDLTNSGTLNGLDEQARLVAIDQVKDKFTGMSAEQLQAIGIGSGDANIIEIGESINLGTVYESLGESDAVSNSIAETIAQTPAENVATSVATESVAETTSQQAKDYVENVIPETNNVPQKPISAEESHGRAVEEAVRNSPQSNLADTGAETTKVPEAPEPPQRGGARFRVANYEVIDKGTGKLLDASAVAELGSSEYLISNELSGQQYDYLSQRYGKEVGAEMREIFDHSREEQVAYGNEQARAREGARTSARLNKRLWGKILSDKFQRSEVGRGMMGNAGRAKPIEIHQHGFVEWEGNPRGRIIGVKNMEMKEILSKSFAKAKGLDSIETTNRHQFLSHIKGLLRTVSPHERETVYEYVLRATAATKNS